MLFRSGCDNLFSRDPADLGRILRRVELDVLRQLVEALGTFFDIFAVVETFFDHHMGQRVEQRDVGSDIYLEVARGPFEIGRASCRERV